LHYVLAAEQRQPGGPSAEVAQRHQITGARAPLQISTRQRERLRGELLEAIRGIESRAYPARPEPRTCAGCPFLFICPA
jgi:CRISPR/Cas system-associated exonuclease Cas4 (RecB family)